MGYQFNYKSVPVWLLSFFGSLFGLSITGLVNPSLYDFIMKYSSFGIVICLVSWHIESKIERKAKAITGEFGYEPEWDEYRFHDKLSNKDVNCRALILTLGITLLFSLILPSYWWLIYMFSGFMYWLYMTDKNLL